MAVTGAIRVGDVGTTFVLTFYEQDGTTILDISSATLRVFYFKKPTGDVLTRTPTLTATGTDGKAQYVSIDGDLDVQGVWEVQGRVTFANGQWGTTRAVFVVDGNLY